VVKHFFNGLLWSRVLEMLLYFTGVAFLVGHVVNRLTSPKPLNPLWNRISPFAASSYGGNYVTAGILMFALCIFLFGAITYVLYPRCLLARAGSCCMASSSLPMALIGVYPTFTPDDGSKSGRESIPGWLTHQLTPGLTEKISDTHNVSSAIGFTLLFAGILCLSVSFLKIRQVRRLGQAGIILLPVMAVFLKMTYNGGFYNGSWQRAAFLLLFLWLIAATRRLRERNAALASGQ
jgi:hypothetical membrane protein